MHEWDTQEWGMQGTQDALNEAHKTLCMCLMNESCTNEAYNTLNISFMNEARKTPLMRHTRRTRHFVCDTTQEWGTHDRQHVIREWDDRHDILCMWYTNETHKIEAHTTWYMRCMNEACKNKAQNTANTWFTTKAHTTPNKCDSRMRQTRMRHTRHPICDLWMRHARHARRP